jgi:hypothetical protein
VHFHRSNIEIDSVGFDLKGAGFWHNHVCNNLSFQSAIFR